MNAPTEERLDESTEEQRAEASKLGWSPIEKWRGDPEHWVDAATYLERGKTMLPLLKATNRRLEQQVEELARANAELKSELGGINANMQEFVKAQREMLKDRLATQRKELLAERKSARDEGDDSMVDEIEEQLAANREQREKLSKEPEKKEGGSPPARQPEPPEYTAWKAANPWFQGTDDDDVAMTALALKYGQEAFAMGLKNAEFYAYIDKKLEPRLKKAPAPSKVEGGGPSGAGGGGSGKGYGALPADAKKQCDSDEKRFVGERKMFKTKEAWRAHFVAQYFGE